MTISITHKKVNNIAAWTQADLDAQIALGNFPIGTKIADISLTSDWNDTHALTGVGALASQDTITVSQISNATITVGSSVSGANTGDQNLAPYLTSSTAASTYAPIASPTFTGTVGGITAGMVGAPSGSGTSSGSNTGDQTTISGNAGTATALQTGRTINGVTFDGTAAITVTAAASTLTGTTLASGVTISSLTSFGNSPTLVTPAIGVATGTGLILTGTSANILAVGANGSTNPVLQVDASTSSQATGVSIKGAAAGGGINIQALSSGSNEGIQLRSKGNGSVTLNGGNGAAGSVILSINGTTAYTTSGSTMAHVFSAGTSGTASTIRFAFTGAADTALTVSTEAPSTYFNMGQTRQHAQGSITLQRDFRITGSTHSFATGAATATDVAALSIDGYGQAGTNATITNAHGLLIPVQAVAGTVTNAYGINVVAPTGAGTLNQAALFTGDVGHTSGNILINTVGKGISIKSGSNSRIGTGTLSGGTLTVANTSVTANTLIFITDTTSGSLANVGNLTAVTTASTGFTVKSTNVLDTSTFNWLLMESA